MVGEDPQGDLKLSCKRVGQLYPVLMDRYGNIIDGNHRLAADRDWPKLRLKHIKSKKDLVLARLISNVCRRSVSDTEKTALLGELGKIHRKEGVSPGKVARLITEETGMSYRWVMKYLPSDFKERPGVGGPRCSLRLFVKDESPNEIEVARCTTENHTPIAVRHLKIAEVKGYSNTDFVSILVDRSYYSKIARFADQIGMTPVFLINNALESLMKKIADTNDPIVENTVVLQEMC